MVSVSPTSNEFEMRDEVLFIEYDRIIKYSDAFLLHKVVNDLYDLYKDYMNIEQYKGYDLNACMTLCMLSIEPNIFSALTKPNFDWSKGYSELYAYYDDMFKELKPHILTDAIIKSLGQKFCKRVYFYSKTLDERIKRDIVNVFGLSPKVRYCYGKLSDVIEQIEDDITAFFLTEHAQLYELAFYSKLDYSEIFMTDYRFNKYKDDDGSLKPYYNVEEIYGDAIVKINEFSPVVLEDDNFEKFINL